MNGKIVCGLCGKGLTKPQQQQYGPTIVCKGCKLSLEGDVGYDGLKRIVDR